jgi:1-acyl-sn-glycerol-3-phosphate acyltransferase
MILYRIRRLVKSISGKSGHASGSRRRIIVRHLASPVKFAQILRLTAAAYRAAIKIEKMNGTIPQEQLQKIMQNWAHSVLAVLKLEIEIKGVAPETLQPVLFVGNHISYIDIPLLLASVPLVFVAKDEVSRWFVIGSASKKAGTVFVKRESQTSRANASDAIAETILSRQQSVGVFPSATTCISEKKPWRVGAFKIAEAHNIPVQPFRIVYTPLRPLAYIDKDTFATHLMAVLRLKKITAVIEFGAVRMITDPVTDCNEIRDWTRQIINTDVAN